eukprot:Stramenopile-MAST_4_protein_3805
MLVPSRLLLPVVSALLFVSAQASQGTVLDDLYFAPYDRTSDLLSDLKLAKTVTSACLEDQSNCNGFGASNPYQILWSVYNVLDLDYLNPLVDAFKAGVHVQVLIEFTQLSQPYIPTYDLFKNNSMRVAPTRYDTNKNLSHSVLETLSLVGIDTQQKTNFSDHSGIMHMKMRYFSWIDTRGERNERVVSGSMNPEDTAVYNEETLYITSQQRAVDKYKEFFNSTLFPANTEKYKNVWDPAAESNLFYSKYNEKGSTAPLHAILDAVTKESTFVALSVYCLRDLSGPTLTNGTEIRLVDAICKQRKKGVQVVVLTDKDCADGDGSFNPGDNSLTALRMNECGVPVYKCKNWGCPDQGACFTAFHHKNGVFGMPKSKTGTKIVTGTANWSGASMGGGVGKYAYFPTNVESQLFLVNDSVAFVRYLSNILYLLRKYGYQQACPYVHPNGTTITDQCHGSPKNPWNQPNWTQPDYTEILAQLTGNVKEWPVLEIDIVLDGVELKETDRIHMFVSNMDGGKSFPIRFNRRKKLWEGQIDGALMGKILKYAIYVNEKQEHAGSIIADPAFDWKQNKRRSNADIEFRTVVETISLTV